MQLQAARAGMDKKEDIIVPLPSSFVNAAERATRINVLNDKPVVEVVSTTIATAFRR
jgi:hypothetical protein